MLGLGEGATLPFFLPVVDDFGSLVEQFDPLFFFNPGLTFKLGFHFFPGIVAGPEVVGSQGAGALPDDLVNRQRHVIFKPENLQDKSRQVNLRRHFENTTVYNCIIFMPWISPLEVWNVSNLGPGCDRSLRH